MEIPSYDMIQKDHSLIRSFLFITCPAFFLTFIKINLVSLAILSLHNLFFMDAVFLSSW